MKIKNNKKTKYFMNFLSFTEWHDGISRKELARAYVNRISGIPQSKKWHPEGEVLNHVRLVRKAVDKAIILLKQWKLEKFSDILSDLEVEFNEEERQILALAAWLHDIGKISATKVDKEPYEKGVFPDEDKKITSYGHENEEHFAPQIQHLIQFAPKELISFYQKHKEIIEFLIKRHMDHTKGFPNIIIKERFLNGKIINSREMKLLLALMIADQMGRINPDTIGLEEKLVEASKKSIIPQKKQQSQPANIEEYERELKAKGLSEKEIFYRILLKKGLPEEKARQATVNKFFEEP